MSQLTEQMERTQEKYLAEQQLQHRVMKRWLQGYSIEDISYAEGGLKTATVMRAIEIKRNELAEIQQADINELVAERVAGLRVIKAEAHEYLEFMPEKAAQLLTVSLRAEEMIAKLQGVLSEKVMHIGRIQHEVKVYDFVDRTPGPIIEAVVERNNQAVSLMEPELPLLDTVVDLDVTLLQDIDNSIVEPVIPTVIPPRHVVNGVVIMRPGTEVE